MNKICIIFVLISAIIATTPTKAGDYSDSLLKCVTTSATQDDKAALAKWMFASFALNPMVSTVNDIPAEKIILIRQKASEVFVNLITERCHNESAAAILAIRSGQPNAFKTAFEALGRSAGQYLTEDPRVMDGINAVSVSVVNDKKFTDFVQQSMKNSASPQ